MPALTLSSLLPAAHVLPQFEVTGKKRLLEEIGFLFTQTLGLERTGVTQCLFARERLGSTGLGGGVAIPHGRMKGLRQACMAFFQLKTPIGFDAIDGAPVDLVFALLIPEHADQTHLDVLSVIAEKLGDESVCAALRASVNQHDLLRALSLR